MSFIQLKSCYKTKQHYKPSWKNPKYLVSVLLHGGLDHAFNWFFKKYGFSRELLNADWAAQEEANMAHITAYRVKRAETALPPPTGVPGNTKRDEAHKALIDRLWDTLQSKNTNNTAPTPFPIKPE